MLLRMVIGVFLLIFLITTIFGITTNYNQSIDQTGTVKLEQDQTGKRLENIPKPLGFRMKQVDSIEQGDRLKYKLNTNPAIRNINHNGKDKSHYFEREVVVNFDHHLDESEITKVNQTIDGRMKEKLDSVYIFTSSSKSTDELVDYFSGRKDVEFVEPHYIYLQNQQPEGAGPNDQFYADYQWNLPMIHTEGGWTFTRGREEVTIAIIDTGVDLQHPDLVHRIGEGYNTLTGDNNPQDENGHGTHVAGIIASETNNNEGVAGISWFNPIMAIKALGAEGYGNAFDIAKGIRWATDHGASVINMSLGNYQPSHVLKDAIDYAFKKDVVLIAASGNDFTDQKSYPAAYDEVLSVSAVGWNGKLADFSNYGDYVDVVAPGVDIASTFLGSDYAALSGTSMASPHVAALAGLIRSINSDLTNVEVMDLIRRTAMDLGEPGKDKYYGYGLIDVENSLQTSYKDRYPLGLISEFFQRVRMK